MNHESLITAILLGHGDPLEVAVCRVILGALCVAPVVILTVALIQAVRPRHRRDAWRYDRITGRRN